ncbi:hypothetical protein [Bradyrhizobium sp. SYSU BS000235]|uniref:hypothetical protein n=1 Tax=Bradyrhizobium sp. SYSU BS000235 TaxID=3411332 RepID=UPI003C7519E1
MMTRSRTSIIFGTALAGVVLAGLVLAVPTGARAAPAGEGVSGTVTKLTAEEFSAQSRKVLRRTRRVPIYGGSSSRYPGPNSVRICNDWYEQEYRPSGTVIVPRMRCYWSG